MDTDVGGSGMTATDEQLLAVAKKPAKPAAPARKKHTLDQVVDAITNNPDRKGVTLVVIKNHLAKQDSSVSANVIKNRLRKALDKGFNLNLIIRPKGSKYEGVSLSGRFLVNKDKLKAIRKDKTGNSKSTEHSLTNDNMPLKKVAKTVKKTTTMNKENVAKAANKVVKAKPKTVKKTTSKSTTISTKTTKAKAVVKAAKNPATTKTKKPKVDKEKVNKPKSATKTATAKKKTAKVLTTKNKMPGTPKITQPKKPRNM